MGIRILVAALLALPNFASAQPAADRQFVEKAAQGGMPKSSSARSRNRRPPTRKSRISPHAW
jgi:hypothetical protein